MSRKPSATPLTLNLSASGISGLVIYCDDIQRTYEIRDFNREEYLNSKLQNSKDNVTFAKPTFATNAVNAQVQIAQEATCGFAASISTGPEDPNLPSVFQRMNIIQYEISGSPSSPTAIQSIQPIADEHKRRQDFFEYYLASLGQDPSYQLLQTFRSQNFNYLTATGLSFNDPYDFGTVSNCLIKEFSEGVIHVNPASQTAVSTGWKLTLQVISISTRAGY